MTSARLQPDGCEDWPLWARACREQQPESARKSTERVITMLEADGGKLLSFALSPRETADATAAEPLTPQPLTPQPLTPQPPPAAPSTRR